MKIEVASRMMDFEEGIFQVLDKKREERIKSGEKVYNLSVGTPDFLPSGHVMEAMEKAVKDPENYKYSLGDRKELLQAVKKRYEVRYGVSDLKEEEIMSVYGSQEGMTHIALSLCDPGDIVLVPNPGYPIFGIGPSLCGATLATYPLLKENDYLPCLEEIPEEICKKAKMILVSYPLNPVCAIAPDSFYKNLIQWAKKNEIIVIHDNAYSDIVYDGNEGMSFLSFEGAKDVGVEFYSLSKSFNLTGARIAFLVGNQKIISNFKKLRSQIDYGIFLPVQYAAIAALTGSDEEVKEHCQEYQRRRDALCCGFRSIGFQVPDSKGTMFAWAPIPKEYKSSISFVMELFDKTGILCTPGSSFGSLGEGYVRFALILPVQKIEEAINVAKESGIFESLKE